VYKYNSRAGSGVSNQQGEGVSYLISSSTSGEDIRKRQNIREK
jgi:hypothetical protein